MWRGGSLFYGWDRSTPTKSRAKSVGRNVTNTCTQKKNRGNDRAPQGKRKRGQHHTCLKEKECEIIFEFRKLKTGRKARSKENSLVGVIAGPGVSQGKGAPRGD